ELNQSCADAACGDEWPGTGPGGPPGPEAICRAWVAWRGNGILSVERSVSHTAAVCLECLWQSYPISLRRDDAGDIRRHPIRQKLRLPLCASGHQPRIQVGQAAPGIQDDIVLAAGVRGPEFPGSRRGTKPERILFGWFLWPVESRGPGRYQFCTSHR